MANTTVKLLAKPVHKKVLSASWMSSKNYSSICSPYKNHSFAKEQSSNLASCVKQLRYYSVQKLNKNFYYDAVDGSKIEMDQKSFKFKNRDEKPLAVILGWLGSKPRNLKIISKLYKDQGFDVLLVFCTPFQLAFPKYGGMFLGADLINLLHVNDTHRPIVVHGHSVGAYVFSEALLKISRDKVKYKPLLDRIKATAWDSIVGVTEMPIGISKTLFADKSFMQKSLQTFLELYMKVLPTIVTERYNQCNDIFCKTSEVPVPALFLYSKTDLVGLAKFSEDICDVWEAAGTRVTRKCWENSPHIQHIKKYRNEYVNLLAEHLKSVNLLPHPEKIKELLQA